MDRNIVYPGSIPLDTDLLNTNRNAMVALGALISATLGQSTVVDGLAVTPTTPATLSIAVGPGSLTQLTNVDQNAYGSLAADTADPLVKMGVNLGTTTFTLAAPTTSGQSVTYLIEAAFQEADIDPVVLPYYNAANPAVPYLGPGNTGVAQATLRRQSVQLQLKAGVPAASGSQTPPAVDAGWTPLALAVVSYGQTQVTAGSIAAVPSAAVLPYKLPQLRPGFSTIQSFLASGVFTVPTGVSQVKVTVIGGGGSGGTHATLPSGGGGAAGSAVTVVTGLVPGSTVPVTVGGAGVAPGSPANGGSGGTSSFGTYVSATGGVGGNGGTLASTCAGGSGGTGVGGDVNYAGSFGTDGDSIAGRGGDGGGPGNGRGTTGSLTGVSAPGYGGGGGGAGAAGGVGAQGGNGGPGIVIVEY